MDLGAEWELKITESDRGGVACLQSCLLASAAEMSWGRAQDFAPGPRI